MRIRHQKQGIRHGLGWLILIVSVLAFGFSSPAQAEEADTSSASDTSASAAWLDVTPPQGWSRGEEQNSGIFRGCFFYTLKTGDAAATNAPETSMSEEGLRASVLACEVKKPNQTCATLFQESAQEPVLRMGDAFYENRAPTMSLLCAPTRDKTQEALFLVMTEEAFYKHEARGMLEAFTAFDMPFAQLETKPELTAYLPSSLAGKADAPLWGGIQYLYRHAETAAIEAKVVLMPYYPHWANMPQVLDVLGTYVGLLIPYGPSWKLAEPTSRLTFVSLSHDKKVLLVLQCATEANAQKYKAAFDKFNW